MTTFVPFTREALARIRRGASAAELGWSATFYADVCRRHGIAPPSVAPAEPSRCAAPAAASPPAPPTPRLPPASAEGLARHDVIALLREPWGYNETRRVVFSCHAGDEYARMLSHWPAAMFVLLSLAGGRLSGSAIAALGGDPGATSNFANARRTLNKALLRTPLEVVSAKGHDGGYALLFAASKAPAEVRLISFNDIALGDR